MRRRDFWRWLITRHHFWFNFVANALAATTAVGLVPDGKPGQVVAAVYLLLGIYGYGASAKDSPPRRHWTDEERMIHGLPPEGAPTKLLDVGPTDPEASTDPGTSSTLV